MKREVTLTEDTRLFFPKDLIVKKVSDVYLVYAIETANWLVLESELQIRLLEELRSGRTIGEVISIADENNSTKDSMQLLSSILARGFASKECVPSPMTLDRFNHLYIYMTNACNLRCVHCFMNSGIRMKDELLTDEIKKLLHDFKENSGDAITFTGGEPTVRADFTELLKYAHDLGLSSTILTNGTLWTQSLIDEVSPYINEVQVSLDGIDEDTNSKIRGNWHFDETLQNIVTFAKHGVQTSVATTLTFNNLSSHTKYDFKALVDKTAKVTQGQVLFRLSKKILQGRGIHYSDEDNKRFYQQICEIEDFVYPQARLNNFIEGHTPNLISTNCGYGGLSISANGDVYVCNRISEVEKIGNVRNDDMKELLNEGKRLFELTSVANVEPCGNCYLRNICGGGCRIDDFNFKGKHKEFSGKLKQIRCNEEFRDSLEKLMVDSFVHHYKF